jgi:methoxylated aromatic compound---corrinoid protein Co-methyltransferase
MASDAEALYRERLTRYVTANYNYKPDRVPLRVFAEEFAAKYCGCTNYEAACDLDLQFDVNRRFAVETGVDAIQTNSIVNWFGMQKALGWSITFPGIGLPVDGSNQWTEPVTEEEAYLKADEYDEFINDPTAFLANVWLPRFMRNLNPPGEPVTFAHNMSLINGILAYDLLFQTWGAKTTELVRAGIVPAVSSVLKAPLDILGDKLRGYVNLCIDLNERRDKVIAACEALMPHLFGLVAGGADPAGITPSIIWMHRGSIPYISPRDFEGIYWATLKPIVQELWARGSQLVLYAEGNWDRHLEAFAELPEKSVIFHVDKTDLALAHRVLGKKFCLSGGIPNELLAFGTSDEVRARCKWVIDTAGRDGGYIMDASALIMDDARVENVEAMIDFTLDYGTYSQSTTAPRSIEEITRVPRPAAQGIPSGQQGRGLGVCVPWEEKRAELQPIQGDETLARRTWERVDRLGYTFCWVSLTW